MRIIDADALEREGWSLCRNYQQDKNTMVYEAKSIAEIPTAQPDLPEDYWKTDHGYMWLCPNCGLPVHSGVNKCFRCGHERKAEPTAQPDLQSTCNQLATDCISREMAIDAVDSETVSTNPEHFKSSEKFIKFMDDADIASFGKWQWANGFNTALVATKIQLEDLPSAQPEVEKNGKWIYLTGLDAFECSVCGRQMVRNIFDYCPWCGADMRGE